MRPVRWLLPVLLAFAVLPAWPHPDQVAGRLLGRTAAAGPDANADGKLDAADIVAHGLLGADAVSFALVPSTATPLEGEVFTISVVVESPVEALGAYEIRLAYPPESLLVTAVDDGRGEWIGSPDSVVNDPVAGLLTLSGSQADSLTEPVGAVEVARVRFHALRDGRAELQFRQAAAADVARLPLPVRSVTGVAVEIEVEAPPAKRAPAGH